MRENLAERNSGPRALIDSLCARRVEIRGASFADVDMMNCPAIIHRGSNIMHVVLESWDLQLMPPDRLGSSSVNISAACRFACKIVFVRSHLQNTRNFLNLGNLKFIRQTRINPPRKFQGNKFAICLPTPGFNFEILILNVPSLARCHLLGKKNNRKW